jgi:hypothetical protein
LASAPSFTGISVAAISQVKVDVRAADSARSTGRQHLGRPVRGVTFELLHKAAPPAARKDRALYEPPGAHRRRAGRAGA